MDYWEDRVAAGVGKRKLSMMRRFRQDICDESAESAQVHLARLWSAATWRRFVLDFVIKGQSGARSPHSKVVHVFIETRVAL